jgi:hypothetical protein
MITFLRLSPVALALALATALLFAPACVSAQDAPISDIPLATPTAQDPPARVARLANVSGQVLYRSPGAQEWATGMPNLPVATGSGLATDANGRATVELGDGQLLLEGGGELAVDSLAETGMTATLASGRMLFQLGAMAPGEVVVVRAPRGTVTVTAPGRYAVDAGDAARPTEVTVLDGSAQVNGEDFGVEVQRGQTLRLSGASPTEVSMVAAVWDQGFADLTAAPPPVPQQAPPPAAVAAMPGAADLTAYGSWANTPDYGTVWYPSVAPDWVPYRYGTWDYQPLWGWTWVDAAPWGFAPFHYGRWLRIGPRWGWSPAYGPQPIAAIGWHYPVYAPALVTFFGAGPSVGWVPLGWGEPYRPWYHHTPRYLDEVNRPWRQAPPMMAGGYGGAPPPVGRFANRDALTVMPAASLGRALPPARVAQPPGAWRGFADARPGAPAAPPPGAAARPQGSAVPRFGTPVPGAPGVPLSATLRPGAPPAPGGAPALHPATPVPGAPGVPLSAALRPGAPPAPGGAPALHPATPVPGAPGVPLSATLRPGAPQAPGGTPALHPATPVPGAPGVSPSAAFRPGAPQVPGVPQSVAPLHVPSAPAAPQAPMPRVIGPQSEMPSATFVPQHPQPQAAPMPRVIAPPATPVQPHVQPQPAPARPTFQPPPQVVRPAYQPPPQAHPTFQPQAQPRPTYQPPARPAYQPPPQAQHPQPQPQPQPHPAPQPQRRCAAGQPC